MKYVGLKVAIVTLIVFLLGIIVFTVNCMNIINLI